MRKERNAALAAGRNEREVVVSTGDFANPTRIVGLVVLLGCQLMGEVAVRLTAFDFPGAVVGMLLFLGVLRLVKPNLSSNLVVAPRLMLKHVNLLFIPAGVGIVVHVNRVLDNAWPLAVGLWGSWLVGLVVSGLVATVLLRGDGTRP